MSSPLARYAALNNDPDPHAVLKIARRVYRETEGGLVIIEARRLPGWADRKQLELLAEKAGVKPKGRGGDGQ